MFLAPKVIAAVVFVWVIAALVGGIYEISYLGSSEEALINKVLFYRIASTEGTVGALELATGPIDWLKAIWDMATFNFSFVTGEMELARWIIFTPLTAMVVYGIIMTAVSILRGTIGAS